MPGDWVTPKPESRELRGLHVPICMEGSVDPFPGRTRD